MLGQALLNEKESFLLASSASARNYGKESVIHNHLSAHTHTCDLSMCAFVTHICGFLHTFSRLENVSFLRKHI